MRVEGHSVGVSMVPRLHNRRSRQWPRKWRGACACGWRGPARVRAAQAWDDSCEHVDDVALSELA